MFRPSSHHPRRNQATTMKGTRAKMYVRVTLLKGNQTIGVDGLRCLPDMFECVAVC